MTVFSCGIRDDLSTESYVDDDVADDVERRDFEVSDVSYHEELLSYNN